MSIVELIGFGISLIALVILSFMKKKASDYQLIHSEDEEESEEDSIANFLKNENQKRERLERKPPSPPKVKTFPPTKVSSSKKKLASLQGHQLKSSIEDRRLKSSIETRRLQSELAKRSVETDLTERYEELDHGEKLAKSAPRAASFIKRLPHLRDMVIYQEIIGKPKGLE